MKNQREIFRARVVHMNWLIDQLIDRLLCWFIDMFLDWLSLWYWLIGWSIHSDGLIVCPSRWAPSDPSGLSETCPLTTWLSKPRMTPMWVPGRGTEQPPSWCILTLWILVVADSVFYLKARSVRSIKSIDVQVLQWSRVFYCYYDTWKYLVCRTWCWMVVGTFPSNSSYLSALNSYPKTGLYR